MSFRYCQSKEEFNSKCKKQCDHCKLYFEKLEQEMKEKRGGKREGSGAKKKYGEKTVQISSFWCPESKVSEIKELIKAKLSEWVVLK